MKSIITAPLIHEERLYSEGYCQIGGMDEVGRGALAGPIVACVVILPPDVVIPRVRDSKKLSPNVRKRLADEIKSVALDYGFGWVEPEFVDKYNVLQATFIAMQQALKSLPSPPDAILVDGKPRTLELPDNMHCEFIAQGDSASHTIAAASILAKVERDAYMERQNIKYLGYGFAKHKGYGTSEHYAAIRKQGICLLHRKTFLKNAFIDNDHRGGA